MQTFRRFSRMEWHARPPAKSYVGWPRDRSGDRVIAGVEIHHSVTPVDPIPVTPDMDVDESARRIQNYHLRRGWTDIFYNELVAYDGTRAEGRPWQYRSGSNPYLTICLVGNYDDMAPSDAQRESIHQIIGEMRFVGAGDAVHWHKQRDNTACPGRKVIEWLEAGMPRPTATELLEPAFRHLEPPVDALAAPGGGLWQVTATGGVYAWAGADFYGSASGEDFFEGREAARLVLPGRDEFGRITNFEEIAAGKRYTILATTRERYSFPLVA